MLLPLCFSTCDSIDIDDLRRRATAGVAPSPQFNASGLRKLSITLLKPQTSTKVGMRLCDAPDPRHVAVDSVVSGGLAEIGGVCRGDLIVAINGAALRGREDATGRIAQASPLLMLEILRR